MARAPAQRAVRCYLCGCRFEVSPRALSTACPGCHKAIKIEDVVIKSYLPVTDLQTCGRLRVTKRGRIAATRIQCGDGIECEGVMEGTIETEGDVSLGPHATWKGNVLQCRTLTISPGAKLAGAINVPWKRPEAKREERKRTVPDSEAESGTVPGRSRKAAEPEVTAGAKAKAKTNAKAKDAPKPAPKPARSAAGSAAGKALRAKK